MRFATKIAKPFLPQGLQSKKAARAAVSKLRIRRKETPNEDGYTEMPLKAKAGCKRACASKRKVVRLPGRSAWKRIQPRQGLNDLTKAERDALVRSLRLAATEQ
jgi:hypothetical protein